MKDTMMKVMITSSSRERDGTTSMKLTRSLAKDLSDRSGPSSNLLRALLIGETRVVV